MSTARILAASLLVSFTTMAAKADQHPVAMPDNTYQGISFGDRPEKPDFFIVAGAEEINGKVAVCGFVYFSPGGASARPYEPRATQTLKFYLNGQKLRVQTGIFRRYSSEDAAFAGGARCDVTDVPWQKGFDRRTFEIRGSSVSLKVS